MKKTDAPGRLLPVKFAHVIKCEYFRRFTFIERLKLLLGYNVVVMCGIAVRHNPGVAHPKFISQVSKHTEPSNHMREVIATTLEESNLPTHQ